MSAPAFAPEGLTWPPVNGSISIADAPTMVITLPTEVQQTAATVDAGATRAELLHAIVADLQRDAGDAGMAQLGAQNNRWGDAGNYENLSGRDARVILDPSSRSGRAEEVDPEDRRAFLRKLSAARRVSGATAADQTVELDAVVVVPNTIPENVPPIAAAQRASVLGSFVAGRRLAGERAADAAASTAPATGFAANRTTILDSPFGQRFTAEGMATEQAAPAPRHPLGPEVRSHRRASRLGNFGFRSARLLLDRMVHRAFGSKGRHSLSNREL